MSKKNNEVEVYKVLFTPQNSNLIERIYNCFNTQQSITKNFKTLLCFATVNATIENLKEVADTNQDYHIIYVGIADGKVIGTFTHIFDSVSNEMYLDTALTHSNYQGQGYGTTIYKKIVEDIFKNKDIVDICACAETDSGRKLLQKIGFIPNTRPISYGGNAILYSPHKKRFPFMIRLECLNEICPSRNLINAPNVDWYNEEINKHILTGNYNEAKTKKIFESSHLIYKKRSAKKTLKSTTVVNPIKDQCLLNLKFSTKTLDEIDDNYSSEQSELNYNLKILENIKKTIENKNGKNK